MTLKPLALVCAAFALAPVAAADSVLRAGQTTKHFQQLWNNFFSKPGKRIVTFDAVSTPDGMRYVAYGIEADHPGQMAYAEMSFPDFQQKFDAAAKDGMGLVDVTIADTPNGVLAGGIWIKGEATASRAGLTQGQLNTWQVENAETDNMPVDLECYGTNEDRKYAVIWKNTPGSAGSWKMEYGLSRKGFQERFNFHVDEGYRLVQVDVCSNNDSPRYGGIFIKTDGRNWYSKGDLTDAELGAEQKNAESQGYALLSVTSYLSGQQLRYSAVWSQ